MYSEINTSKAIDASGISGPPWSYGVLPAVEGLPSGQLLRAAVQWERRPSLSKVVHVDRLRGLGLMRAYFRPLSTLSKCACHVMHSKEISLCRARSCSLVALFL
jgi:hypothetical protein